VSEEKFVEQDFVCILKTAQIDMPLQVVIFSLVSLISTDDLLLKALYLRRKKSVQAKSCSLSLRESCTFVQQRIVEEIHPTRNIRPT
jgi:hypothetical protein